MNITYTYKIIKLEALPIYNGLENVITIVRFKYEGIDSESNLSGSFIGACPVNRPETNNFIEFSNLTEQDVIEWVVINHPVGHMQQQIIKQIENQINNLNTEMDLPWAES
jgi:hypothetical protein